MRKELPEKDIWSWTGYTWEEMMLETPDKLELLSLIDILVDGRYDKSKRNLMLQFRGSSNQRIIDVQKSLKEGKKVVIWDKLNDGKESFEQVKRDDLLVGSSKTGFFTRFLDSLHKYTGEFQTMESALHFGCT